MVVQKWCACVWCLFAVLVYSQCCVFIPRTGVDEGLLLRGIEMKQMCSPKQLIRLRRVRNPDLEIGLLCFANVLRLMPLCASLICLGMVLFCIWLCLVALIFLAL